MSHLATTYQHIADILSFESSTSKLEYTLNNPAFDWDSIVIEGSKHLVLPAIYCRLSQKQLLHVLPEELQIYLEELTIINRNRNLRIVQQVQSISQILKAHHIEHVFLKGSALLVMGCFKDNAERMVGDIDILVHKSQIKEAFSLLQSQGYSETIGFAYETKNFRHLDRLISPKAIAAVELHSALLNKKYSSLLEPPLVLNSKVNYNSISLSNKFYTALHLILSWQIHDHGHYFNDINYKTLYDTLALNVYKDKKLTSQLFNLKHGKSFLALARNYLLEYKNIPTNHKMRYRLFLHRNLMKYSILRKTIRRIKYFILFFVERFVLTFSNRAYTKHVIKKIFYYKN